MIKKQGGKEQDRVEGVGKERKKEELRSGGWIEKEGIVTEWICMVDGTAVRSDAWIMSVGATARQ